MKALWACGVVVLLGCSRAPPAGPQLRAWRVSTPVVIDGELAEPGWLKAPTTGAWRDATEASRVVPHTEARAVFDDDALVIGFYLADEDIQSTDHVGVTIGDATWELPPNAPMRGPDSATGAASSTAPSMTRATTMKNGPRS